MAESAPSVVPTSTGRLSITVSPDETESVAEQGHVSAPNSAPNTPKVGRRESASGGGKLLSLVQKQVLKSTAADAPASQAAHRLAARLRDRKLQAKLAWKDEDAGERMT